MRMMGVAAMAGSAGVAMQLIFLLWMYGAPAIEAAQIVKTVFHTATAVSMLQAGVPEAVIGTGVQWAVAVVSALAYLLASRLLPMLLNFAMFFGAIYGAAVYLVFNFVVPAWIDPVYSAPPLAGQIIQFGAQSLLFGIPMAMTSKMMMRT